MLYLYWLTGLPTSYVVCLFNVQWGQVRGECSFVDVGGFVDCHCLNILFIIR